MPTNALYYMALPMLDYFAKSFVAVIFQDFHTVRKNVNRGLFLIDPRYLFAPHAVFWCNYVISVTAHCFIWLFINVSLMGSKNLSVLNVLNGERKKKCALTVA